MSRGPQIKVDTQKMFALWNGPLSSIEVASSLGISVYRLYGLGRRYGLRSRRHVVGAKRRLKADEEEVVGEEYERRKAEVQAGWSDEEREKRRVGPAAQRWQLPSYAYDGRVCAFVQTALD